jgi:flagellar assembly factor FliW
MSAALSTPREAGAAARPVFRSSHLGEIEWEPECELFLPAGLPGFEAERRMMPLEIPAQRPLVFLQSLEHPDVCFVALPVRTIDPHYRLRLSEDDRAALLLDPAREPEIGADVLCLVLLLPGAGAVQANLDAPIVVNLHNSRCIQAFSAERPAGYFRLGDDHWEPVC